MPRRSTSLVRNSLKKRKGGRRLRCEALEGRLVMAVVISEFLAENDSGIEDAAGRRHDWIELTNTGASVADVSGWSLTDDAGNLAKWQIPVTAETTSLAPGEKLLVFASGSSGEVGVVGTELHANFQLSQEPGYLGLVRPDGVTVESEFNLYPQQTPDISFGLGVGVNSSSTVTFLSAGTSAAGDGSPAQFRPYTGIDADVDDHWREIGYVAGAGDGWVNATNGLGFGYGSPWQDSTVNLNNELAGYTRMPFVVTDAAQLLSLSLELRVDNGYIVYLNGREVQRERIATTFQIGHDWTDNKQNGGLNARQNLDNGTIMGSPAVIDLTPWLDTIEEGDNVLAIYAANHTSDTGDYLVHANLTAERAAGPVAETFMVTPTPGEENGAGYLGILEDTVFSHDRGFYDAPFDLTIAAVGPGAVPEPGTTIRYTTDGTRPTLTNGLTYTGPITVSTDGVASLSYADAGVVTVRAAAFKPGYFSTNVDTQSYVFLDDVLTQDGVGLPTYSSWGNSGPDWDVDPAIVSSVGATNLKEDLKSIPTISLVMDWEELFGDGTTGDGHGIYTQIDDWREKSDERYASLEYFTDGLTEEFQIDAVVEIQGHSSTIRQDGNWRSDKMSFDIKFKQPYDTKLESDTLFGNAVNASQNVANRFDSIVLDAQYNYTFAVNNTTVQGPYATYVHDQVVADLANMAGVESPNGRWVHLYINGLYWGIYNAHERPSDAFAEEYFGGDKDDYFVVKGFEGQNLLHGGTQGKYQQADGGIASQEAYQNLIDTVRGNLANLAGYQDVADLLDIDAFIDYVVVLIYAGNYDWGELNWFASFNSVDPDGKWRFHSWDQEHAFPNDQNDAAGGGTNFNQAYDHFSQLVINDFGEHEYGPTGIHLMLMESDEYRLRFSDRVEKLLRHDGVLTPANAQAVWQARVDEIADAINGEAARWGDNRSPDKTGGDWATNAQYTSDHFFFANGPYQSRTDTVIDIFNSTSSSGVGKGDWLVNLDAPTFSQYGGEFAAPFNLTMTNPNGGGVIYYTLDGTDPRTPGGGISPTALSGGSIVLTEATRVRARVFDAGQAGAADDWSAEVDKAFVSADPLSLRIVELMYNPAASGDLEYIELLNTGSTPIDLAGVRLADFSTEGYVFASQTLGAGERIVVPQSVAAFQAHYPSVTNVTSTAFSGSLSNGGETVTLVDALGNTLQSFAYDDDGTAGWPTTPDGGGPSLEYVGPLNAGENPLDGTPLDPFDDPVNWVASAVEGGTPGADGQLPGDYDRNGTVEQADHAVWASAYGQSVAVGLGADGNGDGVVNAADYTVWRDHLGMSLQPAFVASTVALAVEASAVDPISAPLADATGSEATAVGLARSAYRPSLRSAAPSVALRDSIGLVRATPPSTTIEDALLLIAPTSTKTLDAAEFDSVLRQGEEGADDNAVEAVFAAMGAEAFGGEGRGLERRFDG
ncbi:CotH kinase family protein [Botrimarina colliarenosi]|nr:CotH kinase family protein [Botrimarina colliarenosi]